ncbi:SRPBCC family protein [Streptomyces sp. YS-3]|uniref:SRPBCC family protein n=1 Tax=Streptomyces sp. YS-3 TaxID=3381352 RepID=UPI0038629AE6
MAVRHRLVRRPPQAVWGVLSDPSLYGEWVVGPSHSTPLDHMWPEVGSRLSFTLKLGPWATKGMTVVRYQEPAKELELEAVVESLGTARILLQLRPWGEETLIVCDEHPLHGLGGTFHNPVVEAVLQLRHRGMLSRLAALVERRPAEARHA